jgi:hypothetical protein
MLSGGWDKIYIPIAHGLKRQAFSLEKRDFSRVLVDFARENPPPRSVCPDMTYELHSATILVL